MRELPVVAVIDEDYALIVGRVVTLFAYVEWMLRDIVYRLVNIGPKNGRIIVKDFRANEYPDLIATLAELNNIDIKFDAKTLSKLLDECESNRNMLAHSIWFKEEDGGLSVQITRGNWPKNPRGQKTSKRIKPEGRRMTPEYTSLILQLTDASVRTTIPIWNAVLLATQGRNAKSHQQ